MAVGIKDVAAAAGVSVGTVSNVLNRPHRVSESVTQRVQRAISELGYVRNDAARQLRAGRSRTIGLVVPDASNPFFAEMARGAEERAAEEGLVVLLGNSEGDLTRETAYLELYREQRVNGVLITPASDDLAVPRRVAAGGLPVVLLDRRDPEAEFAAVDVDDVAGGRLAAEHLLTQGRRRVAFVGGPNSVRQVADRLRGAREAIAAAAAAELEVIERPALTVLEGRTAGEELLARPQETRPDAVFAANDLLAVGLLQSFAFGGGIRVPEDIALIGYDDIDFAAATVVPLSSVRQPARLLGRTAVDVLLREVDERSDADRPQVRFSPQLIVRASTAG